MEPPTIPEDWRSAAYWQAQARLDGETGATLLGARPALDVYDAALDVCAAVLDLPPPRPPALVASTRALLRALAAAGLLDP